MARFLIVLSFLASNTLLAQFEGIVESTNTTTDETGAVQRYVMTVWVKGAMARVSSTGNTSSPASTMIYRNDLKTIWMVNDEDKTYSEIVQGDDSGEPMSQGIDKPRIRRTGKTKKVLGYKCEQVLISQGESETEIWGTKALASLSSAMAKALGDEPASQEAGWPDEVMRLGLFPLLASTRIEGHVIESQEVVRIEPKKLQKDLFTVPQDYKKQTIESLMK